MKFDCVTIMSKSRQISLNYFRYKESYDLYYTSNNNENNNISRSIDISQTNLIDTPVRSALTKEPVKDMHNQRTAGCTLLLCPTHSN